MKISRSRKAEKAFSEEVKKYEEIPDWWIEAVHLHIIEADAKLRVLRKFLGKQYKQKAR